MPDDYFICPNCGAEVPLRSLACPECGSDDRTGWSEDTLYDGLDLPDLDAPEPPSRISPIQKRVFMLIIAVISLVLFLLFFLR